MTRGCAPPWADTSSRRSPPRPPRVPWAAPAGAHAVLVRSLPPSRATLAEKPDRVQLWFNERLEPAFSSVSVWSAAGTQVDAGDARVAQDDAKRLSVTLPALPPGAYSVRYRVLSSTATWSIRASRSPSATDPRQVGAAVSPPPRTQAAGA